MTPEGDPALFPQVEWARGRCSRTLLNDWARWDRDRPGARGDRIEESVWGVPAPALRR